MKLKEWIPIWQEQYDAPSVRQSTYEAHRYLLENHILPRLGKWELNELTNGRIRRFYTQCQKTGNHRTNQPLSDVTMRHIMILLRKILRQAVADGWLETEPMADWSFHETKVVKTETLTVQEVADYLDAAEQLGYSAMFTLAIHYGLRQRELIALKWSDVEMYSLYKEKSTARDELVQEARETMQELIRTMRNGVCELPEAETLMISLANQLKSVKGKKAFAYLPKEVKQTVNEIVDQMARLRPV